MSDRRLLALPAEIRAAQNLFENWRRQKRGRDRIPDRLWQLAVKLCDRHTVHRVARWLRLNDTALRERARSAKRRRGARHRRPSAPAFVEWVSTTPTPLTGSALAEYVVELEGGPRIRVRGAGPAEIAALAKLLRGDPA
jgi:hypothetical protein